MNIYTVICGLVSIVFLCKAFYHLGQEHAFGKALRLLDDIFRDEKQ
jgi:hypothetical protein